LIALVAVADEPELIPRRRMPDPVLPDREPARSALESIVPVVLVAILAATCLNTKIGYKALVFQADQ
jgi:hypothetical protein